MSGLLNWWQHLPSHMNPVIFHIGSFPIRWYGTMYLVAFALVYWLVNRRIVQENLPYSREFVGDAVMYAVLGVIIGGRLGYVLFYGFSEFMHHPLSIILPFAKVAGHWRFVGIAGMSYHGGVLGVIVAWLLFARKHRLRFLELTDLFVPAVPLGYTFGRLGNFINGELYGRVTTAPIGMYFPAAGDGLLRHPSQLYEAFFEGIFLFVVLWNLRKRSPFTGFLSGAYLLGYGLVRFFIEFYRQPDPQLGFVLFNYFTRGQELCFLMIIGAGIIWYLGRKQTGAES